MRELWAAYRRHAYLPAMNDGVSRENSMKLIRSFQDFQNETCEIHSDEVGCFYIGRRSTTMMNVSLNQLREILDSCERFSNNLPQYDCSAGYDHDDFERMVEAGTKAWADVHNASEWVAGLRCGDEAVAVKNLIDLIQNENERITSLESVLSDLLDLQNGCPLPSYKNEYDQVVSMASKLLVRE